jgi:peptidoglycan/xylan/chitin deacetylase (PgdA/CDA1 family)
MNNSVTIIMYHYVRDLRHSRYPEIKGLDLTLFKEQVLYLKKHYHFISVELLLAAAERKAVLPPKACLLTFDDAYTDHFLNVFPFLRLHMIPAAFFPPVHTITQHKVLDVNKIHFILAAEPDKDAIIREITEQLKKYRSEYALKDDEEYYLQLAVASRYDSASVMYIKNMLQYALPVAVRNELADTLFEKFVGVDEASFSRELYMSEDQLKCLLQHGMHLGSHTASHCWLGKTDIVQQRQELADSAVFLKRLGVSNDNLTICYPYGSYNDDTLQLLPELGFRAGFTTEVEIADITKHHLFTLPRLDTNDIPKDAAAQRNAWYSKG